jgi:hypothetical protein
MAALIKAVRRVIMTLSCSVSVFRIASMQQHGARSLLQRKFRDE